MDFEHTDTNTKTHKQTESQKKDERSTSTVMPRCLMATFATMKKVSEEGGRHERGVSRNRGLPRNPRIGPSS